MAYKFIDLKRNKRVLFFILILLIGSVIGIYWNHKMKNEMIVKFTETDPNASDFPTGKRKIDASPWIKKGYKKIDSYKIYNPNPIPLKKDFKLVGAVSRSFEHSEDEFPQLHNFFTKKDAYNNFLKKDIKIKYLYSSFNQDSNLPTNDYFGVTFDNYQITIVREPESILRGFDLKKITPIEQDK